MAKDIMKESSQHWGRRRNIASQGLTKEYEIILNNAMRLAMERRQNT